MTNSHNSKDLDDYKIEKGIPVQPMLKRTLAFPLDEMSVGDSFVMPLVKRNNLTSAFSQRKRNGLGGKFVTRRISDTDIRVWRIE